MCFENYYKLIYVCVCSNLRSKTSSSRATVQCHFHVVIIKSEFSFTPETDVLTLRCNVAKLGGWKNTNYVMSVEK